MTFVREIILTCKYGGIGGFGRLQDASGEIDPGMKEQSPNDNEKILRVEVKFSLLVILFSASDVDGGGGGGGLVHQNNGSRGKVFIFQDYDFCNQSSSIETN